MYVYTKYYKKRRFQQNRLSLLLFKIIFPIIFLLITETSIIFSFPRRMLSYSPYHLNSAIDTLEQPFEDVLIEQYDTQENPLTKYLSHYQQQPVKTLSEINNRCQQIEESKQLEKICLQAIEKQVSVHQIQVQYFQSTINQRKLTLQEQKTNKVSRNQDSHNFKDLAIKIESFIQVKQEPIQKYYKFKQFLGEGSYGQVFRAVNIRTKQERAIKVLKSKNIRGHSKKQLLSQLTLLSKLQHPCIITLYQVFLYQGKYYIVMQYCKGGCVSQAFKRLKNKSQKVIKGIMKQLLSVLNYLSNKNIIHRDIKLQNMVFLNPVQSLNEDCYQDYIPIKIIDFGAAVQSQLKTVNKYPSAGTTTYMAPEVINGVLTSKSDMWSAAVLMTILLTGQSPFKGVDSSQTKKNVISKVLNFHQRPFKYMSPQARRLVQDMFNRDFNRRISPSQALKSSWFSQSNVPQMLDHSLLQKLQSYQKGNNLISIIQSFLSITRITQQQRQCFAQIFQIIDSNSSGTIQCSQLLSIYQAQNQHITRQQAQNIVKSIDKDKSGKIDFNQFLILMCDRRKLFLEQALDQAFDYFDKDKSGFIQLKELKKILKGSDKAEVQYLVEQLDRDGDNRISRKEFVQYLRTF